MVSVSLWEAMIILCRYGIQNNYFTSFQIKPFRSERSRHLSGTTGRVPGTPLPLYLNYQRCAGEPGDGEPAVTMAATGFPPLGRKESSMFLTFFAFFLFACLFLVAGLAFHLFLMPRATSRVSNARTTAYRAHATQTARLHAAIFQ